MAFRGLFVGIDRYASPRINWLSCAQRDATALHALFTDNLGGAPVLLTDSDATGEAIEQRFESLVQCSEEDVVVVAFSGHGSETHELVTYDADPDRLEETAISLETLTQWFARIPARRLVCILDCCFSGGMGAKVLRVDARPRTMASEEELLARLSGEGRLILTASTAQQPAWEMTQYGHGLLTHFVLRALQGAEEVRQAGTVSILRLLQYVTERVTDAAAQFGKDQHPTIRGQIDGELRWPIFTTGPRYEAAFPEWSGVQATADILSLEGVGIPPELLACWAAAIPSLNALQLDAINEYRVLDGEHLVISAPTSAGKTMVGELAAIRAGLRRQRTVFLLPLKALVNDKYRHFVQTYASFGLRVIRATGDIADDIPALMRGQYDIALLTYEKFASLLLGKPHILEQVGTVVVDEVQMIADTSRGLNLEFLITLLRMRRRLGIEPQLVALSAVIGDSNGFERWINARLLRRNERPVPLNEGVLLADGRFRHIAPDGSEQVTGPLIHRENRKGSSQDWIIPLVRRLISEDKQVIVFRETKGEARGCAGYLAKALGLAAANEALADLSLADPSLASEDLRKCLQAGVAFHVADLDADERRVVEEHFRRAETRLRVIAATTTLAMGVNTPAEAVIIAGLEHPGNQPYSVAEYKNMVGRAGRLGFASEGTSYLLALTSHDEYSFWTRYVTASPEDLESRFTTSSDLRSLILRVLVAAQRSVHDGVSVEDVVDFLEGSFGAYRHTQTTGSPPWSHADLTRALTELQTHDLVASTDEGRFHLTSLGRFAGESGVEVESIVRLVAAFRGLQPEAITDPTLIAATQLTVELDDVFFPINRRSTQKEPQAWVAELRRQGVSPHVLRALGLRTRDRHEGTLRAKKATACLLWITDRPMVEIEHTLTQFGGAFGGAAGPIRAAKSRTCDLLPTVVHVAQTLHPECELDERCSRLLIRLETGIPGSAVEIASLAGSRLNRGDYHQLVKAGMCSPEAVLRATDDDLLVHLGGDAEKLVVLRNAAEASREATESEPLVPILPPYEP